jgi:hypothetical protein
MHVAGILDLRTALLTAKAVVEAAAATAVAQQAWRAGVARVVLVAPHHQLRQHSPEPAALSRQDVFVTLWTLLVEAAFEDPFVDQPLQSLAQNLLRSPKVLLEFLEAPDAQEGVPNDQQRPTVTDDLQRSSDRANLFVVCAR